MGEEGQGAALENEKDDDDNNDDDESEDANEACSQLLRHFRHHPCHLHHHPCRER